MTTTPSHDPHYATNHRKKVPVITWVGIGLTALLALIVLVSDGVWLMLAMIALVILITTAYGLILHRKTWLRLPRKRAASTLGIIIASLVLLGSATAYGATHPTTTVHHAGTSVITASPTSASSAPKPGETHSPDPTSSTAPTPTTTPTPVITTKVITKTIRIPFHSVTVDSATLPKGTSSITTTGVDGVETKTYVVTYSDGIETSEALQSDTVTKQPVSQVTTVGTHVTPVAPTCANGTYVNSAGEKVCRPEAASSAPSGATARCVDGTYSFSQSRRGTCSSHGGVAEWL